MAAPASAQTVDQTPLSVGGNVPGNLVLTPSVEWPTVNSVANLGEYSESSVYTGYFDEDKCYQYQYSATEADRHFSPISTTTDHRCTSSSAPWSGNFLNWAVTQTIDPFRKALTGGNRVKDTSTETWLEKARHTGQGGSGIYPNRRLPGSGNNSTLVDNATPFGSNWIGMRIQGLGNKMRFRVLSTDVDSGVVDYNPAAGAGAAASACSANGCEVSVRVKVCVAGLLESNCKQYSSAAKPEGLIQKYSERIRYSVFGYLNDHSATRDGAALRAKQKFVGANNIDPVNGVVANANREWDSTTGILVQNPDTADATATAAAVGVTAGGTGYVPSGLTVTNSGVINYINKFGQMTQFDHKQLDPVSELYYAAIRYLKNQGNVSEYSTLSGTSDNKYIQADGFPVISTWSDPLQYACQNNAILGIGDVNSWNDKNLPGSSATASEPTKPSAVSSDTTVNVETATQKVAQLEGITIGTPFTGRENSAYIAGLAYDSHTKDMRPGADDFAGKQTVSTYWVDVREAQVLQPRDRNQYWLAAKYGGFEVPENFDPYTQTAPLDAASWSSGETLSTGDIRPENFYVASEAGKMVESLTRAFATIASKISGSASSLASNSTRLETGTKTFQAKFSAGTWAGELSAFSVNSSTGALVTPALWEAGVTLNNAAWSSRNIFVYNPQGSGNSKYVSFAWGDLGSNQRTALGSQAVVDYLRGDRSNEESRGGAFRVRTSVLGDIVNSTPIFVGAPNPRLYAGATFNGASSYGSFASANAGRNAVVYVGSNDGMLHGFDADGVMETDPSTGATTLRTDRTAETYAFVPNTVILNGLKQYTDPAYQHRYFVDGEIALADVYLNGNWKTILVGTLGRGGPGVFALDVTNPAAVEFLWEKSGSDIAALGKNIGRPVIAQVANGDWRVLIGNGPGSSGGSAQLISIALDGGAVTVANTGATGSNGLTAVLARDSDGNGFADVAYAGDLSGNLWKFTNLSGTASATKMFQALDKNNAPQPITAAPLVGKDPATGTIWVFFGTGQYFSTTDLNNLQVQSWYGLKDTGVAISGRGQLVKRDILAEGTVAGVDVRVIEEGNVAELVGQYGWYMDLEPPSGGPKGERMIVPNRFQGDALIGTTRIPEATDPCKPTGKGFVMAINPFTGARLATTFFDVSRDGQFNSSDTLSGEIVSGIGFGSSPNNPIFIEDVMQVGLDDGTTQAIKIQGSGVQAGRMSWREILN